LCNPSAVTQVQERIGTELAGRTAQLDTLIVRINGAVSLASTDRAALVSDIDQTELPGIQSLQAKVPQDATCMQLRQDARGMVFDYRVYLVMTPQTDLVIASDALIHAEGVFADVEPVASQRIQYAAAHGVDVAGAQSALAGYRSDVGSAQSLTSGESTTLLAQSPAGYPGNRSVFLQARTNLSNARNDLRAARSDLRQLIGDLG
jgi:hypothetical protein